MSAASRSPRLAPGNCSVTWDGSADPAWGTASPAGFWVALEQRGPWGRKAFIESRLDPAIGEQLEKGVAAAGGRALLIRDAARERHSAADGYPRRVYVAGGMSPTTARVDGLDDGSAATRGTEAPRPWLLTGEHTVAADVAALPFEAIARGDSEAVRAAAPWLQPATDPEAVVVLVCTNAKRDVCCALRGRPLVEALAAELPGRVWECSHTGGHRFAPTGVLLPHGLTLARIPDAASVVSAVEGLGGPVPSIPAGLGTPHHLRGLAHLSPIHQAADGYVRHSFGVCEVSALTVTDEHLDEHASHIARADTDTERNHFVCVTHRDGRSWRVRVTERQTTTRPVSCGAPPVAATAYHVTLTPPNLC
ncbi:MAG: sucrase ferredoxin [Dermatophilus congolensis]|nr:sucrase ferredoxin [Dermatophilus congolensis]